MWNNISDFRFGIFSRLSVSQPLKIKTHKTEISLANLRECENGYKTSDWESRILHTEDRRNL
jgi:hypothetical protein